MYLYSYFNPAKLLFFSGLFADFTKNEYKIGKSEVALNKKTPASKLYLRQNDYVVCLISFEKKQL